MAVFQSSTANRKQPIAYTYQTAAQQIETICGPGFVNDTLPAATVLNAGPPLRVPSLLPLLGSLLLGAAMHWLL